MSLVPDDDPSPTPATELNVSSGTPFVFPPENSAFRLPQFFRVPCVEMYNTNSSQQRTFAPITMSCSLMFPGVACPPLDKEPPSAPTLLPLRPPMSLLPPESMAMLPV